MYEVRCRTQKLRLSFLHAPCCFLSGAPCRRAPAAWLGLSEAQELDPSGATRFRQRLLHTIEIALEVFVPGPASICL